MRRVDSSTLDFSLHHTDTHIYVFYLAQKVCAYIRIRIPYVSAESMEILIPSADSVGTIFLFSRLPMVI